MTTKKTTNKKTTVQTVPKIDVTQLNWELLKQGSAVACYPLKWYEQNGVDAYAIIHMVETYKIFPGTVFDKHGNNISEFVGVRFGSFLWKLADQLGVDLNAVRNVFGKRPQVEILKMEIENRIQEAA